MQPKAETQHKTFSRSTTVSIAIAANPDKIWSILTDASNYKNWNSTIVSLQGDIAAGSTIQLVSTLDSKRTFKLAIKTFEPPFCLVWGDFMGKRKFSLEPSGKNTQFTMTEKIGGPLFPLFANKIPAFDASFEAFALDLKKEAEK